MIYADHNGTSPVLDVVRSHIKQRMDSTLFANPNAIHSLGHKVKQGIEKCRVGIAETLGAHPSQVIFNSGSTEGISQVLYSLLLKPKIEKKIILVSPLEHSAVLNTIIMFQNNWNYEIEYIPVLKNGVVDWSWLQNRLKSFSNIALVAVMAANNETGVIQPFEDINSLCQKHNVPYFCDTTQWIGKAPFHFEKSNLDFAAIAGHKTGSLPGIGVLLVKNPELISPLIIGGGQESNHRGGTQNYLGIESLFLSLNEFKKNQHLLEKLKIKRLEFENKIKKLFPQVQIIGDETDRLAGTTLIGLPGVHGQAVQIELESQDIFVTTSSACSDNEPNTSRVLKSMGAEDRLGRSVVRISFSVHQNMSEYDQVISGLTNAYNKLLKIKT